MAQRKIFAAWPRTNFLYLASRRARGAAPFREFAPQRRQSEDFSYIVIARYTSAQEILRPVIYIPFYAPVIFLSGYSSRTSPPSWGTVLVAIPAR